VAGAAPKAYALTPQVRAAGVPRAPVQFFAPSRIPTPHQLRTSTPARTARARPSGSRRPPPPLQGSKALKDEGNRLIAAGNHAEAAAKYERAKSNLKDLAGSNPEARDLRRACVLNLSVCLLRLGRYEACAEECGAVLQGEADGRRTRGGGDASVVASQAAVHSSATRVATWWRFQPCGQPEVACREDPGAPMRAAS
jgi:hypothetical protein